MFVNDERVIGPGLLDVLLRDMGSLYPLGCVQTAGVEACRLARPLRVGLGEDVDWMVGVGTMGIPCFCGGGSRESESWLAAWQIVAIRQLLIFTQRGMGRAWTGIRVDGHSKARLGSGLAGVEDRDCPNKRAVCGKPVSSLDAVL